MYNAIEIEAQNYVIIRAFLAIKVKVFNQRMTLLTLWLLLYDVYLETNIKFLYQ